MTLLFLAVVGYVLVDHGISHGRTLVAYCGAVMLLVAMASVPYGGVPL
jgi:hypothetical protein